MEIDPNAASFDPCNFDPNGSIIDRTYIYIHAQPIAMFDGDMESGSKYFYLHDRLGSVRAVVDSSGDVVNRYTYEPYGTDFTAETEETVDNPFKFTGQYHDEEIEQYHLRARQYDIYAARFTARDAVTGMLIQPLTLHRYLYCANDPINRFDASGEFFGFLGGQGLMGRMRASSAAFGARVMAIAGRAYAAAMYLVIVMDFAIYQFMTRGQANLGFFRSEWGKWGGSSTYKYHFHLPWGPGLGKHHLPYEFINWWKNFSSVYLK